MKRTRVTSPVLVAGLAATLGLALVIALAAGGGVGYARGALPRHSVGVKQLKKNAVTATAIKAGAVTGDKVADGSLSGADLAPNSVTGDQVDEASLAIPGATGSLVLSGEDFKPRSYETSVQAIGDGGVYISDISDYLTANLPVPSGATITKIVVYAVDNGPDSVDVRPVRDTPSTKTMTELSTVVSSNGASTATRSLTVNLNAVDDGVSDRRLLVQLGVGTSYQLYGAQVTYTYTARLGGG